MPTLLRLKVETMMLTKNFSTRELGGPFPEELAPNAVALAMALEKIRAQIKEPLFVTSGYRDPERNRRVGGVKSSAHVKALAADVFARGWCAHDLARAAQIALAGRFDQIIWYPVKGHVHVSVAEPFRCDVLMGD